MKCAENIVYMPQKLHKKDRLKIVLLGKGTNKHYVMPYEPTEDMTVKIDDFTYNVAINKVFLFSVGLIQGIRNKLHLKDRIRRWFIVFFVNNDAESLEFKDAPESEITSVNLSEIVFSKVIGLGVSSLFRKKHNFDFNIKTIIMVVVVVGVVIGIFLAWQQGLFKNLMGGV
jgi:hypothetical protein